MKNILKPMVNFFKKEPTEVGVKYMLVFMSNVPEVHFIEKDTLTEIYNIIVDTKLPDGTYKVIKGKFIK
jgi:hypothetical protein